MFLSRYNIEMFSYLANQPLSNTGVSVNEWASTRIDVAFPVIDSLPKSAQGYSTNNQFVSFPPLMNDGRSIMSGWYPDSRVSNQLVEENGIKTNWQYRKYLNENANELVKRNFAEVANDTGHYDSMSRAEESNFTFLEPRRIRGATPLDVIRPESFAEVETSDLKQLYLTAEQLNRQKQPVVLTQEELLRMKSRGW